MTARWYLDPITLSARAKVDEDAPGMGGASHAPDRRAFNRVFE